ncbi:MAG TPA: hypothetical protein VJB87_01340 [Candidatus Nanoarchaeia archaeon]|nr:hypothetical protein [Candidatus Nanoarchaeia archaeon]
MEPNNLQIGDTISIQEKTFEVLDITEEHDKETKQGYLNIQLDQNHNLLYYLTTETCYLQNGDKKTLVTINDIKLL